MTELQEKIESFQNLLVDIATSGNRPDEEENFKKLRTVLITNNEINNQIPDFVRTTRTVSQFWQFIKGKFKTYAERKDFIWNEFSAVLDHLEEKQNSNIYEIKTSGQTETMKDKLIKILEGQVEFGNNFSRKIESLSNINELDDFLVEYEKWNGVNTYILDKAYVPRQLFQMYSGASSFLGNVNIDKNSFQGKRDKVLYCLPRQLGHLRTVVNVTRDIRNTDLLPIDAPLTTVEAQARKIQNMNKLFISHSSKDDTKIKPFIDLIENIGVPHTSIFYSSHPAYGVGLGENIFTRLKTELEGDVFALFMLSDNFYNSPVCLCEMGAVWIKSNKQIPILIPPFDFNSVQGVFTGSLGFKLDDKKQLNNFKSDLESYFKLTPINYTRWEEKRDEYLSKIEVLLK